MAGRALSHQHLAATQPNPPRDFWDRHQLIDSIMMPRMAAFSLKYPAAMQEADPVLMFVSLMWRATVLFSQVTERVVAAADDSGFVVAEYARRSSLAAQEVVCMAKKLTQLNWFKVSRKLSPRGHFVWLFHLIPSYNALTRCHFQIHPLMPIPLSLCSELLNSHNGLEESVGKRLPLIREVMNDIKCFNNLGRGFYNYQTL
jgi:hypothetical protein